MDRVKPKRPKKIVWPTVEVVNTDERFGYLFNGEYFSLHGASYTMPRFHTYRGRVFMIATEFYSELPVNYTMKPVLLAVQDS